MLLNRIALEIIIRGQPNHPLSVDVHKLSNLPEGISLLVVTVIDQQLQHLVEALVVLRHLDLLVVLLVLLHLAEELLKQEEGVDYALVLSNMSSSHH